MASNGKLTGFTTKLQLSSQCRCPGIRAAVLSHIPPDFGCPHGVVQWCAKEWVVYLFLILLEKELLGVTGYEMSAKDVSFPFSHQLSSSCSSTLL